MKKIGVGIVIVAGLLLCGDAHASGGTNEAGTSDRRPNLAVARQAGARQAFTGVVVGVNIPSRTISVRDRGYTVTFDATNPVFSGYRGLMDVRVRHRVAVSYVGDGVRIARLTGKHEPQEKEPSAALQKKQGKGPAKLQKRERRGVTGGFEDVDANKDGRVTAVELSVIVTDITMDRFRQYDKDGDGCLSKTEFIEAVRQQKQ